MEERKYRGSLIFPVIMIVAGVVFLLNNLGILGWGVWPFLWRLWPVVLIALGLDLLVGRRFPIGSAAVAVMLLTVLGGAVWYASARPSAWVQPARTQAVQQPLGGAARAEVDIRSSIAVLRIGAASDGTSSLVTGRIGLLGGEQLVEEYSLRGDTAYYQIKSDMFRSVPMWGNESRLSADWDLDLNSGVPLDLRIGTGVGRADIDLSRLTVRELKLDSGVGKTTVMLPDQGRLEADINVGIGDMTVMIPRGMAAKVHVQTGIGSVNWPSDYRRNGDTYTSPDYESADHRVDLQVKGGVGKVSIETR